MAGNLPYEGYSWTLSHHAAGFNEPAIQALLKCALPFSGQRANRHNINELFQREGVLTENVRDNVPDAWRDYQQLLPELGLMVSTKLAKEIRITSLGHFLLAGDILFREAVTMQVLRYQYPNGFKETAAAAQIKAGVMMKPGLLLLRILLTLAEADPQASLSVDDCLTCLLPLKRNVDWPAGFAALQARGGDSTRADVDDRTRRNVSDWFKLLASSDLFRMRPGGRLALSTFSSEHSKALVGLCDSEEQQAAFWVPRDLSASDRLRWFDYFGSLSVRVQSALGLTMAADQKELGTDEADDAEPVQSAHIVLGDIDFDHFGRATELRCNGDLDEIARRLLAGAQKRHAKSLEHDRIVRGLAAYFRDQGAIVKHDPNSIDLYVRWPKLGSAIFEIKTVTSRSLQQRLRGAIGQVQEYAFRLGPATADTPDKVIVVNALIDEGHWSKRFVTDYLGIALLCISPDGYVVHSPAKARTVSEWPADPDALKIA
jgi:hypothetical protein